MNIDVPAKLAEAEATLVQLQAAISANSALATIMSGSLVTVSGRLDDVKASVDALVAALSYDTFHPVCARRAATDVGLRQRAGGLYFHRGWRPALYAHHLQAMSCPGAIRAVANMAEPFCPAHRMQVYTALKGYVCCTVLNSIGATWLGIVIACSFALMLIFFAFIWVGR